MHDQRVALNVALHINNQRAAAQVHDLLGAMVLGKSALRKRSAQPVASQGRVTWRNSYIADADEWRSMCVARPRPDILGRPVNLQPTDMLGQFRSRGGPEDVGASR